MPAIGTRTVASRPIAGGAYQARSVRPDEDGRVEVVVTLASVLVVSVKGMS